jgi:hypothetical protein
VVPICFLCSVVAAEVYELFHKYQGSIILAVYGYFTLLGVVNVLAIGNIVPQVNRFLHSREIELGLPSTAEKARQRFRATGYV